MMTCDNKDCATEPYVGHDEVHIERFSVWLMDVLGDAPSEKLLRIDLCTECKKEFRQCILDAMDKMKGRAA